jgi:ASC-1-like (ASCH) protein
MPTWCVKKVPITNYSKVSCNYMNTWESGRESSLLDAILDGRKTIEGRLNKGKFAEYAVGDTVSLRRDIRGADGVLRDGQPGAATVEIIAIRQYSDFLSMVTAEGFEKVIPSARNPRQAADEYDKFYSREDQARYGVLAIEIRPI